MIFWKNLRGFAVYNSFIGEIQINYKSSLSKKAKQLYMNVLVTSTY